MPFRTTENEPVSFMRGIVESTIKNMSPEERDEALQAVMRQVVSMMSAEERRLALIDVVTHLAQDLPDEARLDVVRRIAR